MATVGQDFKWETAALPLAAGVDLRTPGRSVENRRLLEFTNGEFSSGQSGLEKRRGHVGLSPATDAPLLTLGDAAVAALGESIGWVYGVGETYGGLSTLAKPFAGRLSGAVRRDKEALFWDGWRLHRWRAGLTPGQGWGTPVAARMPHGTTAQIVSPGGEVEAPDLARSDTLGVVTWLDGTRLMAQLFDPETEAPFTDPLELVDSADLRAARCVVLGDWAHVVYSTTTALTLLSFHRSDPWNVRTGLTNLGTCNTHFDVRKLTDSRWIVAKREAATNFSVAYLLKDTGEADRLTLAPGTELDTRVGGVGDCENLAVAVHPQSSEICLVWRSLATSTTVSTRRYSPAGVPTTSLTSFAGFTNPDRLTVEAGYTLFPTAGGGSHGQFWLFWHSNPSSAEVPRIHRALSTASGALSLSFDAPRFHQLSHHAFRVGNEVYVGTRLTYAGNVTIPSGPLSPSQLTPNRLQRHFFVLRGSTSATGVDSEPVARFLGPARPGAPLGSVHFDHGQDPRNRVRFHGAQLCAGRPTPTTFFSFGLFEEPHVLRFALDFDPPLRAAQLGGTTYFAGAQLNAYDGQRVTEAGFHTFPENVFAYQSAGGGGLLDGTYRYRVRYAYRDARGEEVVSAALFTNEVSVTVGNRSVVKIPNTIVTSKPVGTVYALVYRNVAGGTVWHLVSSRDPALAGAQNGYPAIDPSQDYTLFEDTRLDAGIVERELDRAGLETFSPPASTVIASGRDRLWLAGGEIPGGDILPSLLKTGGSGAEFNQFLQTAVSRGPGSVRGFGFLGHSTIVFKERSVLAIESDGPDNLGAGLFDFPRVIVSEVGAVSQEGLALTPMGLIFQSPAGFRLIDRSYQVQDIGQPVKPESTSPLAGSLVVPESDHARFYTRDGGALVWNYRNGEWSVWTGLECAGVVENPDTGLALLARRNGRVLEETDGVYTDDGVGYEFRVRTAWLSAGGGLQDFQRVRRVVILGDYAGPHILRGQIYYDDRDFPEDDWYWNPDDDLNAAFWGGGEWGDGIWGDHTSTDGPVVDRVLVERRRCARQKCSRFSVAISDGGAPSGGAKFSEIAFEIGRREGLTRVGPRSRS
jgi:hypothetical protein